MTTEPRGSRLTLLLTIEPDPYNPYRAQCQMMQPPAWSRYEERYFMAFSLSPRLVRTALASAALLVLGTVAAPAANAYNPDIDGDGIPNTRTAPSASTSTWMPVAPAAPSTTSAGATKWRTNSSTTP